MTKEKDKKNTIKSAACLLLSIAHADEILIDKEIKIIKEILIDFFEISNDDAEEIYIEANQNLSKSTDLFSYGKILNDQFSYQDKIDFVGCIFEVAFIDGDLHYIEQHTIKSIANILNLDHNDLIRTKMEIKRFL